MRRSIALLAAATTIGCASRGRSPEPVVPATPEETVAQFLDAVSATSMETLGQLWGSSRGPAIGFMEEEELLKRRGVIVVYLQHERYEITPATDALLAGTGDERRIRVQLYRRGCTPVVPFTLTRWNDRWLVSNIDLQPIGNPARACEPSG
ncbi:MAG: hypothetical protein PVH40_09925 [Gemmatimonadales bacterium]